MGARSEGQAVPPHGGQPGSAAAPRPSSSPVQALSVRRSAAVGTVCALRHGRTHPPGAAPYSRGGGTRKRCVTGAVALRCSAPEGYAEHGRVLNVVVSLAPGTSARG